ncbi:DUF1311 domain-containing protein [Caldibacillus lycopersici]|uniref:DUF1311 domain-containing protein n=1 Tax=Perspicuibacillus lycopersici TaxID=1325689 RepID=A0AAE3LNY4_9BACI|nr:lysozyme inhibitor LprI family protein [Perspicuibacillus lycopersici]MCU9614411.1 DUF1311 domain-containing protein [Perspicuibacillus lycopersici]
MKKLVALSILLLLLILAGCEETENGSSKSNIGLEAGTESVAGTADDSSELNEALAEEEASSTEEESTAGEVVDADTTTEENNEEAEDSSSDESLEGIREKYLQMLENTEKEVADLEKIVQNGTQTDMEQAQAEIYAAWDKALNDIYGELKRQLSESDMYRLKEAQREWIIQRDDAAIAESKRYEGGSLESFTYVSTQTEITKFRCYDLIDMFM